MTDKTNTGTLPANYESDFLWLEDIQGERALAWVEQRNSHSLARLESDPRYEPFRKFAEENYTSTDRIPYGQYYGGMLYNFWQDSNHVKGIARRSTLAEYAKDEPAWDVFLDIDQLARDEAEDWVYKGRTSLAPDHNLSLVHLSRGGSDASEIREFDVATRSFVPNGFFLAEAKTRVAWLDRDHLLVATDFGPTSLTKSGYPRILKKWKRGTPLSEATVVLEADVDDTLVAVNTINRPEGAFTFVVKMPAFFKQTLYFYGPDDSLTQVPFPEDVDFRGVFKGKLLAMMRSDWGIDEATALPAGSFIAIDMAKSLTSGRPVDAEILFEPADNMAIGTVGVGRDTILVSVMEDVSGVLYELTYDGSEWTRRRVDLPTNGTINVITTDGISGISMVNYESFLVPDTLYIVNQGGEPELVKTRPSRFDASAYVSEQKFAISADGTKVPYYMVRQKDLKPDGRAPTIIDAYGGFEVPRRPVYFSALGIEWMKSGGVFVLANLRGGGEYGPRWHKAALLENRQKAYDDHIAVAEALIADCVTSPSKLGIRGGSNGGLLVMAVLAQRPNLYGAVICAVPLLDMLRYHKLSAGASWMAEYGDPDAPEQREFISRYSPYQNIQQGVDYPEVFFWTNMKDDRVHPSHARRMVAKMLSQDHDVLYFENTEGGHGGGADPLAMARTTSLELVYLKQMLLDEPPEG